MAFDECPPFPCEYSYAKNSMNLTHRWLDRCINQFNDNPPKYGYEQIFFPIVQGSTFKDLRRESAYFISSKNCFVDISKQGGGYPPGAMMMLILLL